MSKSFIDRRQEKPDYELEVWITGVILGTTGKTRWNINVMIQIMEMVLDDRQDLEEMRYIRQ